MARDPDWNDEAREGLRETLQEFVVGELRLAKNDHASILETCKEAYIDEECPTNERADFVEFATTEIERAEAQLATEKLTWPAETDCDRLDQVEAALRDQGILFWQVSPCCDTCTGGELYDRVGTINERHPGFADRLRGYAFFIDQSMPEMLSDGSEISLYLAYGWFPPDDSQVEHETYQQNALSIAREVCQCLRNHGFEVHWDGDISRKIGLAINWQRRTLLT